MLSYNDLNENEKIILKRALHIERMTTYYLEDHNILIMNAEELFEYLFLDELNKIKEAKNFIKHISQLRVSEQDLNKSLQQILIEKNEKIIKLSDKRYAYKEE